MHHRGNVGPSTTNHLNIPTSFATYHVHVHDTSILIKLHYVCLSVCTLYYKFFWLCKLIHSFKTFNNKKIVSSVFCIHIFNDSLYKFPEDSFDSNIHA